MQNQEGILRQTSAQSSLLIPSPSLLTRSRTTTFNQLVVSPQVLNLKSRSSFPVRCSFSKGQISRATKICYAFISDSIREIFTSGTTQNGSSSFKIVVSRFHLDTLFLHLSTLLQMCLCNEKGDGSAKSLPFGQNQKQSASVRFLTRSCYEHQ